MEYLKPKKLKTSFYNKKYEYHNWYLLKSLFIRKFFAQNLEIVIIIIKLLSFISIFYLSLKNTYNRRLIFLMSYCIQP
ncbi:hypothetical protein XD05_09265 [Staphylococcus aureus]|nr:hypothetical protein NI36_10110 [Staphylococcus aureus]OHS63002.1 hypothetical protein HMPREF3281_00320 [Staphylococcus sp. HMSC73A05]APD04840.1 hypothetical protein SA40TW_10255 [Staphylococcus aureus]ATH58048.1 hypothetical protein B7437_10905 [Staphylococcus aureus]ATN50374.1 hypothetical protein AB478_10255 [Staphylococcus aureus]